MSLFDLNALTMNPEEAQSVSEAVFERVITGGELAKFHDIVTGITHKKQIPFIGNLGLVGKKITDCARNENPGEIPLTEKFWDPELIGDRFKHCAVDVPQLFKLFQKAKKANPDWFDRIDSEELGVITTKIESAMQAMLNRLVWFGDKAADNVSGTGVITDGVDVDYFNPIDGLWKQIMSEITPSSPNYVAISANAGNSYANQALADNSALKIFRAMYNKVDARFFQAIGEGAEPELLVTRELFQNYQDELEDKSLVFTLAEAKDGVTGLHYRGIPIKVKYDWDSNIRAYQDSGTKWNLPHRALLTVKENIPVGTLSTEDFNHIESWYEKKDKANYMDVDIMLDAKFLLDYMAVAAY